MWKGRFEETTAGGMLRIGESVSFDWRLYRQDVRASIAHARGLLQASILNDAEFDAIDSGLRAIEEEITAGQFVFRTELEDLHMNIEAELTRRIGEPGAKLHTARSRNDQVSVDMRLYCREACDALRDQIRRLQQVLVALAGRETETLVPGYTHLQRGQPVVLGHHLLAYVEMLARDHGRLGDARRRLNVLPLGSGALAGSTILLDREAIARELEFEAVSTNSMDAVSDRDFIAEILFALALLGTHLSRLSEDLILWSTAEFGFLRLSDAYTTGSSLMPQKKNPDVAELTRGKTGRLYGNLVSLLTTLKGLPMTYNRDLQEDKEPLFDSLDTASLCLEVFADMMETATFLQPAMAQAASDPLLLATDLADYLVRRGVPFRHAHEILGQLTAKAVKEGRSFREFTLDEYRAAAPAFAEDLYEALDPLRALALRDNPGSPAPGRVRQQINCWQDLFRSESPA